MNKNDKNSDKKKFERECMRDFSGKIERIIMASLIYCENFPENREKLMILSIRERIKKNSNESFCREKMQRISQKNSLSTFCEKNERISNPLFYKEAN